MSKRYGRNQKRRHREEIARLTAANTINGEIKRELFKRLREAEARIAELEGRTMCLQDLLS